MNISKEIKTTKTELDKKTLRMCWWEDVKGIVFMGRYSYCPYLYDTLELNLKYLEILIATHNNLKRKRAYRLNCCLTDCKVEFPDREKEIRLCEQAIKDGILSTGRVANIGACIEGCQECLEVLKMEPAFWFRGFSFTDDQIFDLIRKNEKWRNIERDITIFREGQKGKNQQEIGENYGIKFTAVSKVITKVQGAVNY